MEIHIPKYVDYIIRTLNDRNFAAYAVGGAIRDSIMGYEPKDWDVATSATPEQVKKIFTAYPTGEKYGTVTVAYIDEQVGEEYLVEVTTFRYDQEYSDGRRPDKVVFGESILDDLARRDFTINAIAWHPDLGFIDPYEGVRDCENKILRCVGNPHERFQEDALRILRAIRFTYKYNLDMDSLTHNQLCSDFDLVLTNVSKERIHNELKQILSYMTHTLTYKDAEIIKLLSKLFEIDLQTYGEAVDFIHNICAGPSDYLLKIYMVYMYCMKSISDAEIWMRTYKFSNKEIQTVINLFKINWFVYEDMRATPDVIARKIIYYYGYDLGKQYILASKCFKDANQTLLICIDKELDINKNFTINLAIDNIEIMSEFNIRGENLGKLNRYLINEIIEHPGLNNYNDLYSIIEIYIKDNIMGFRGFYETDN